MSKIEHIKLKNGLNIYYYANSSFNLSTCIVEVGAGSFMEDRGVNNGWSHFLEHMMFKNSKHWNTRDRLNKMSENAVDWNAFTGSEEIYFYFNCPNIYYEEVFDIYLDMLFNPSFDEDELKVERNVVIAEMKQQNSRDSYKCMRAFSEYGFGKEARKTFFSNSTIGLLKDLKKCNSESLRDWYEKYFDPRNLTIIMTGPPRNYEKLVKKIEALDLKPNKFNIVSKVKERIKIANNFRVTAGYELMHVDGRNSSFIFLWKNALPIKHMKEIPLLINVLVAYKEYLGGGPNSVLWNKLREEKGHVYAINLYNEINEYTSYHYIASEVNSSRLDAFFRDYCDIMDEFADKGIDDVSFKRLMKGIKNNYYHDKNDAYIAASNIMVNHSLGLPIETLNDYYKKFQQIPKETINDYHRTVWKTRKSFVTSVSTGDKAKELRDILHKYGIYSK